MKFCGRLNGYCVHQDKDTCDGCKLMEVWLEYKEKSANVLKGEIDRRINERNEQKGNE